MVAIVGLASGDDAPDPVELKSDAPTFTSLDELVAASDVVVVATVADVSEGRTLTAPDDPDAGFRTRLVELDVVAGAGRRAAGAAGRRGARRAARRHAGGRRRAWSRSTVGDQAVWFLVAGDGRAAVPRRRQRPGPVRDRRRHTATVRRGPAVAAAGLAGRRRAGRGRRRAGTPLVGGRRRVVAVRSLAVVTADDLAGFRRGDPDAVRAVYREYGGLVFAVACARSAPATSPRRRPSRRSSRRGGRPAGSTRSRELGPWLATIARRTAIDIHRREARRPTTPLDDVAPADPSVVELPVGVERSYEVAEVRAAIDTLPPDEREIVRLQHLEELTHTEVAERLGVPVGTVKSRSLPCPQAPRRAARPPAGGGRMRLNRRCRPPYSGQGAVMTTTTSASPTSPVRKGPTSTT